MTSYEYNVLSYVVFFFFKQRPAYEIDCDWSSDVCSSDLHHLRGWSELRTVRSSRGGGVMHYLELVIPGAVRDNLKEPVDRSGALREMELRRVRRPDRKSVRVGKECRSRWSPYH